jgi:hypothetical protein
VDRATERDIATLKRRAKQFMLVFQEYQNTYDCGSATMKHINPVAAVAAQKYNETMEHLRALDPENFPPGWEPL